MLEKMFDSVIIASDSKDNNKVRFCNDLAQRVKILQRDKFVIHFSKSFDTKLTQKQLLDNIDSLITDESLRDVLDEAYERIARRNTRKTNVDDVFNAILSRKQDNTKTEITI
jgi:hypothetical protein